MIHFMSSTDINCALGCAPLSTTSPLIISSPTYLIPCSVHLQIQLPHCESESAAWQTRDRQVPCRETSHWFEFSCYFYAFTRNAKQKMKCSHSQCSNSFVFMFILSNFALLLGGVRENTRDVVQRTAADWTPNGAYFQFIYEMPEIVSTEILLLARTGPKTRRLQRRHEHVSVPIFVILFRLLFSLLWLRKFENISCIGSSNCPTVQLPRQSVHPSIHSSDFPSIHPSIHPFSHPSIQRFAFVHQMLSRGSYFRSVHKYLARQLHLALSRRRLLCARLHNFQLIEYIPHN